MNQNNQLTTPQSTYDVLVIGAGIGGMSAAIYLKRAGLNVGMIDGNAPGGQLNKISDIENYPGYAKIDGPTLAYNIFDQTMKLGIKYIYGKVVTVINAESEKIVKLENEEIKAKAVIIASGRKPRDLGLENEKALTGRGISWCAICDGALFKDKDVAIIGGGNSALEGALYLENLAKSITLVHRRDEFRGDKILVDRVLKNPRLKVLYSSVVEKINETDGKLSSIDVKDLIKNENQNVKIDGLFIYIGFEPATEIYKDLNLNLNAGYIIVDSSMRTNIKGIYACGDAIQKEMYQLITAAGEGALAANSAIKDLDI